MVSFTLPPGNLTKMLLAHIMEGHKMLTLEHSDPPVNLFVQPRSGLPFSDATLSQFWAKVRPWLFALSLIMHCMHIKQYASQVMRSAEVYGIDYYPPSKGRVLFVESFTEEVRLA